MDFRPVARLSTAPLIMGLAGAAVAYVLVGATSATGFAGGALLIAVASAISGGFYMRGQARTAGRVVIRLALTSALRWLIVMGGAAVALVHGGLAPAAFTCGVIAGLVSTLFNRFETSTGASTS